MNKNKKVSNVDLSMGSIFQTIVMLTLAFVFYSVLPPSFSKMARFVPDQPPTLKYSDTLPYTIVDSAVEETLSKFHAVKNLILIILWPSSFISIFIAMRNGSGMEVTLSVLFTSFVTAVAIASYKTGVD